MNALQAIDIIISQWSHQHVKISLVNGSEKTVDPINSVSGKEYSEDWKVTDKANILPLNKHSRTGEDDKWWDCVSLKTDWTNGMLDFALRGINTPSGERARDLVNSVCTDRRKISADSAFGARTAPSPAHGKTRIEAWKGEFCAARFVYRRRGTFPSGSPSLSAGSGDGAKSVCAVPAPRRGPPGRSRLLPFHPPLVWGFVFFLGTGMWNWVVTKRGKKGLFLGLKGGCARKKNTFFSCLCPLLFPNPPVGINWVHPMWNSEKLMGCDFSVLFTYMMQKYAPWSIQIRVYVYMGKKASWQSLGRADVVRVSAARTAGAMPSCRRAGCPSASRREPSRCPPSTISSSGRISLLPGPALIFT